MKTEFTKDDIEYTIQVGKDTLNIIRDDFPSYADYEFMGAFCVGRNNYLPQEVKFDFSGNAEQDKEDLLNKYAYVFPLYLMDHSVQHISLTPFGDPWDSGQVGWYVVPKEYVSTWGITSEEEAYAQCDQEIHDRDDMMNSNVFGYEYIDKDGEVKDSCWGYIGYEGINAILMDFKLPFKVLESYALCLLPKSRKVHTNRKTFAECEFIMTKDGPKLMRDKKQEK